MKANKLLKMQPDKKQATEKSAAMLIKVDAKEPSVSYVRGPRFLLDVNMWVALFDGAHIAAKRANAFIALPSIQIATCPIIENGVIRVLNLPNYGRRGALGLQLVRNQMILACSTLDHEFWPDDISLRDNSAVDFSQVHGHNQVTDLYLLSLAVKHQGVFVTFDQNIPIRAVHGAQAENLLIL